MPDGELIRTSRTQWKGILNGYSVELLRINGQWHNAIFTPEPKIYTKITTVCDSLADGGRRARKWIEANPL